MHQPQRNVRVVRTAERRSPRGVRRLGQALIALAQAQLEAEAEAEAQPEAKSKAERRQRQPMDASPSDNGKDGGRPAGDAA